jgi:carboxymethylenebutenolidase
LPGYLAVPAGDGPRPGVVVIQDGFGMTADIRRIADRFAANGYLALAPALYQRGFKAGCVVRTFRSFFTGSGPAVDDLVAARDYLAADDRCTGKVGSAGFCLGGGFCLLLAPRGIFDATAPSYGLLPKRLTSLRQSCPMVASYGAGARQLAGAAASAPPGSATASRRRRTPGGASSPSSASTWPDRGAAARRAARRTTS